MFTKLETNLLDIKRDIAQLGSRFRDIVREEIREGIRDDVKKQMIGLLQVGVDHLKRK